MVTISGRVTYDFVPANAFFGLNYAQTDSFRPVRSVTVQFVDSGNNVLASTQTDLNGDYSLDVNANQTGLIRVRAEVMDPSGEPNRFFRVVDNTEFDALYTLDGEMLSSGTANSQRDLHAQSGWTGDSYGEPRAAAPFAILDTILIGRDFVFAADPTANLPGLNIHWSENNVAALDVDGEFNSLTGEIGGSRFRSSDGLYLLGEEDVDTEEYDRHVILHEFAHYLEFRLGRSDSIGGTHGLGDRVDLRVAFSEGWATAFAGLALDDPIYRDTVNDGQASSFFINIESQGNGGRGWYSEQSVQELIFDLVDANIDGNDFLTYPFSSIWSVMTGPVAGTPALTSIFPFLNAIKDTNPGDQVALDLLASGQDIGSISTDFGVNEVNDAGNVDVLPIYTNLTVNDPAAVNLCSTDAFKGGNASTNKLAARRFIRFTPPVPGNVSITMTATSIPASNYADPDFQLHRRGALIVPSGFDPLLGRGPPNSACEGFSNPGWVPGNCKELATIALTNTEHVLEVYEWTNTNPSDDPDYPPIGRTCFDVTVTQP
jgi:hypothetical protein